MRRASSHTRIKRRIKCRSRLLKLRSPVDDRKTAAEAKFTHDQEFQFKTIAQRNKLLGLWAAEQMGISGADAEAYAKQVVIADIGYPVRSRNSKKHQRFQWHVCEQASSLFSIIPLSFSMPYGIKRETEVDTLFADFEEPGDADVLRRMLGDLTGKGIAMDEHKVFHEMTRLLEEAKTQVSTE